MKDGWIRILQELTFDQITNIIPVLEKGIEIEKLHYLLNQDTEVQKRIVDAQSLLTFLPLRKFDV